MPPDPSGKIPVVRRRHGHDTYHDEVSTQILDFVVQPEDRPLLDELVDYFGDGNRSAYLRATFKVMRTVMLADQLRIVQGYGQQRTGELGIDLADVPTLVQAFLAHGREQNTVHKPRSY